MGNSQKEQKRDKEDVEQRRKRLERQEEEEREYQIHYRGQQVKKLCAKLAKQALLLCKEELKYWSDDDIVKDFRFAEAFMKLLKEVDVDLRDAIEQRFYQYYPKHAPKEEEVVVIAETPLALQDFVFEYRYDTYLGNEALIAFICAKKCQGIGLSDYTSDLVRKTVLKLRSVAPPDGLTADEILQGDGDFVQLVVKTYNDLVFATDGIKGEGTQLGNTQANYSGMLNFGSNNKK